MYAAFCPSNEVPDEINLQGKWFILSHRFGASAPRSDSLRALVCWCMCHIKGGKYMVKEIYILSQGTRGTKSLRVVACFFNSNTQEARRSL